MGDNFFTIQNVIKIYLEMKSVMLLLMLSIKWFIPMSHFFLNNYKLGWLYKAFVPEKLLPQFDRTTRLHDEPRHEKTGFLPRRKQRRRSASR